LIKAILLDVSLLIAAFADAIFSFISRLEYGFRAAILRLPCQRMHTSMPLPDTPLSPLHELIRQQTRTFTFGLMIRFADATFSMLPPAAVYFALRRPLYFTTPCRASPLRR